ncbi:MAG: class I SAM-dependent methyltransferase, partial [Candidatus Nealsonbacteria bacterium]|nr:class I SAM-dependent methyltransferase [Candidatus Nealsonbacteria bacterium]
ERKQKEIEYYNKRASFEGDFEGFRPQKLSSFRHLYKLLEEYSKGKAVLDYGCGNGVHSLAPLRFGAQKVVGIDLSENQLVLAKKRAEAEGMSDRVEFIAMDCEKLEFPDNSFDLILDGGTFSSLDLNKALAELRRVLKPNGLMVGIETFGHNPLTNFKRKLNKLTGRRTGWAEAHIFQEKDLVGAKNYFNEIRVKYFHVVSWLAFPFLNLPGSGLILKGLEALDGLIFSLPLFKKYAFKVVFVFAGPKK